MMPSYSSKGWAGYAAPVAAAAVVPLCDLLHELGHYIPARIQGYTPELKHLSVSFSAPHISGTSKLLVLSGGPFVDLLLSLLGIFFLFRCQRLPGARTSLSVWIATVLVLRSLHWFGMPFYPISDECKISVLLGWPQWWFPVLMMPMAVWGLVAVLRFHFVSRSLPALGICILACLLVSRLYMYYLGPLFLPRSPHI